VQVELIENPPQVSEVQEKVESAVKDEKKAASPVAEPIPVQEG
jgi:hypothetical protein